jgi:hypothetical protein
VAPCIHISDQIFKPFKPSPPNHCHQANMRAQAYTHTYLPCLRNHLFITMLQRARRCWETVSPPIWFCGNFVGIFMLNLFKWDWTDHTEEHMIQELKKTANFYIWNSLPATEFYCYTTKHTVAWHWARSDTVRYHLHKGNYLNYRFLSINQHPVYSLPCPLHKFGNRHAARHVGQLSWYTDYTKVWTIKKSMFDSQ